MDSLKKALKGMLKRNKKNKQGHEQVSKEQSTAVVSDTAQATPAKQTTQAPQLSPVHDVSPLESPSEQPLKALPPTHPLATGQHSDRREAVPLNHDARPGPVTLTGITEDDSGRVEGQSALGSKAGDTGFAPQTNDSLVPVASAVGSANAHNSSAGRALELNDPLNRATKTDSGIGDESGAKENFPPKIDTTAAADHDKMVAAREEPPPLKAVSAAPGMSATSGPLEDFPEGGEKLPLE